MALVLSGCSLTGVTDFEPGQCRTDADCRAAFNHERGYYEACAAFKCVDAGARKDCVEVKGEVCDGEDNDCDRLIDEANDEQPVLVATSRVLASGLTDTARGSLASSPGFGAFAYVTQAGASAAAVSLEAGQESSSPLAMNAQVEPAGSTLGSAELSRLSQGCYLADGGRGSCNVGDLSVAAGQDNAFFAAINVQGCSAGELRVGMVAGGNAADLIDRGRGARAPTYRGVATRGSDCTDNGSAACAEAKRDAASDPVARARLPEACGVSAPAVAALPQQGLVAFLGQAQSSDSCDPSGVPVLALGLHEAVGTFNGEFIWSNPTGDGEPDELGRTTGGAAPAVLALGDAGFVVGFGNKDGNVQLLWVPAQPAPPPNDGLSCADPLCDDRSGYETERLRGISELLSIEAKAADGVRLTALPLGDDRVALLVTWVEGCARRNGELGQLPAFAKLLHWSTQAAQPELKLQGPTLKLGSTNQLPLSAAAPSGFVVPGLEREGTVAKPETSGGFYVFAATTRPRAVRVAAFDGQRVDAHEVLELPEKGEQILAASSDGQVLSYRHAAGELAAAGLGCE